MTTPNPTADGAPALVIPTPAELLEIVGIELGPTAWTTLTLTHIDDFELATEHRETELLTVALANLFLPQLLVVESFSMGVNVGLDGARYGPTPEPGNRLRGLGEVMSAAVVGEGVQVVVRITIEIEGAVAPTCILDTVSRFFA